MSGHHIVRLFMAALMSITVLLPQAVVPAYGASERALYLYYTHTRETARIVFKRNGQYVQSGLNELNQFLRDWRRNEPAKMDPRLFDLIWEVYQEVGATQPVHIVSAYRSPATNAMLRETSSGVAENSQHTKGNAMDFFIPGIPLTKLRAVAMKKQVGGVGYYPSSGSPFVHLDTGSVRAWPRMTRAQLQDLFPDGKTMHLPTDGKPLSQQGYQVALAEWKRCHAYPCNGRSSGTAVADAGSGRTLMDMLFGGKDAPAPAAPAPSAPVQVAATAPQPAPAPAAPTASTVAPIPFMRPASLGGPTLAAAAVQEDEAPVPQIPFSTVGSAPLSEDEIAEPEFVPFPVVKSAALQQATAAAVPSGDAVTALAAVAAPVPQPRLIMSEPPAEQTVIAYLPTMPQQDAGAQRTLEALIEQETTAAVPTPAQPNPLSRLPILPSVPGTAMGLHASLGVPAGSSAPRDPLFAGTFGAAALSSDDTVADALAEHVSRAKSGIREPQLVAPDLEHAADVLLAPASLTSSHFAVIHDHDEADFDPTPEMGNYAPVLAPGSNPRDLPLQAFGSVPPIAIGN
ncbi:DUF882 domain-containing protein [Devosia albogilva]|uniref:Murein endopeptidase K n=1 Tax=Devosia albogilva TaxID=429726 RepID=A0ABW5QI69_9HYPH